MSARQRRSANAKTEVLRKLKGGDRRSIGRVDEVVADVMADHQLFAVVVDGMLDDDPIVRMRCADASEKISRVWPKLLESQKQKLIHQVPKVEQQEVRWHLAQMPPRLRLNRSERQQVLRILAGYLGEESKIVKTFSMQAMADLAAQDAGLRDFVVERIEWLTHTGSAAMRSRGRKLLTQLKSMPLRQGGG